MDISKTGRIVGFAAFTAFLVYTAIRLWPVILPFFLSVVFAYLLQPAVNRIVDLEVEPGAAIIIVYACFYLLLFAVASLCLPLLNSQFISLFDMLPQLLDKATRAVSEALDAIDNNVLRGFFERAANLAKEAISNKALSLMDDTAIMLSQILRAAFYAVLIPFLSFHFLRDKSTVSDRIVSWLPVRERSELLRLAGDVDHLFRQYVLGYFLVSIAVALLSTVFYWGIGLDYALALGIFMGLADLIPYFGPFIGAIPSVAVALSTDLGLAVLTVIGLLMIQQLESLVITPKVIGDRVGIHPLTTIFAVLAGGWLFGLLGAVLAVPVTAAGLLVIRYLWSVLVGAKIE